MSVPAPHYILFSEARQAAGRDPQRSRTRGQWRFVLEDVEGQLSLEAAESEPDTAGERLELLAVVRGLEALDQPSRVTLFTPSRYVTRGIRFGLNTWRENGWKWEDYGRYSSVANDDLWKRIDRAMKYHQVQCRTWRFDRPHTRDSNKAVDSNGVPATPGELDPQQAATPDLAPVRMHWAKRFVKRVRRVLGVG